MPRAECLRSTWSCSTATKILEPPPTGCASDWGGSGNKEKTEKKEPDIHWHGERVALVGAMADKGLPARDRSCNCPPASGVSTRRLPRSTSAAARTAWARTLPVASASDRAASCSWLPEPANTVPIRLAALVKGQMGQVGTNFRSRGSTAARRSPHSRGRGCSSTRPRLRAARLDLRTSKLPLSAHQSSTRLSRLLSSRARTTRRRGSA